jgi:hypothetical protein
MMGILILKLEGLHQIDFLTQRGRDFDVNIAMAACEACSETWNLRNNTAFTLGPRRTSENLDRAGWSQDLPVASWILASSPV